ncbi:SDR family NAD(P)-dependent oxidoreductase [Nonomuraea phyllanthi]|uniref:SDR family NAD(P)-dependent oxidoreductase n=1 Tax=Nonomuraea phyllanthi TaxID=2219224 RepID=A0A5C4WC56_9ACTN|nr:SDR family NAD(P)-dependent oxidoreductase [Nonomuraea phyllanthi]KAB8193062.1 SDR family NAD(P)-dependent oxidoreductase [Nonomuraea phyllanthi]QFY11076.1 SDR family NAD(P)-dependent oxidoreductase [Nonomuraea phyllanthi]
MRLDDAHVLVTGASSGIGAATARALAGTGARLTLAGRDRERLAAVSAATGGRVLVCDVTTQAADLASRAGHVDVLVNNAGVGWAGPFVDMPDGSAEQVLAVNLAAPIALTRLLLPGMVAAGRGHVVFVASIAGAVGVAREAVYSASKAGLLAFAEGLRHELHAVPGVGVSVLLPGVVDTPFFVRRGAPYTRGWPAPIAPERVARAIVASIRHGRPESFVPGWLRLPARLRGAAPGPFRRLARRFG